MIFGGISGWMQQWIGYCRVERFFVAPGIGGAQVVGEDRARIALLFMSAAGGTFNLDFDRNATTASGLVFDPNAGNLLITAEWFPDIVGSRWHAVGSAGSQLTGVSVTQQRELPANNVFPAYGVMSNGKLEDNREPAQSLGDYWRGANLGKQPKQESLNLFARTNQPIYDILRRLSRRRSGNQSLP